MATIQGIYIALFGRPADPAGLAFFNEQTNNGADLTAIGDLAATDEYQDRFDGLSNVQVVTKIYQDLFGRDPDAAGLAFFVAALNSGTYNINNVAIAILDGAQGDDLAIVNNKVAAANLFTAEIDTAVEIGSYVGDDAANLGRAFLSGITADPAIVPTQADAAAAVQGVVDFGLAGNTIEVASAINVVVGTDTAVNSTNNNDIITVDPVVGYDASANINAGLGNDRVNITLRSDQTTTATSLVGVERLYVTAAGGNWNLDLDDTTGLRQLWASNSGANNIFFENLNDTSLVGGIDGANGEVYFDYDTDGNEDSATIVVNGSATVLSVDEIENVTINVTGPSSLAAVNVFDATQVTITGTGNLTFGISSIASEATVDASGHVGQFVFDNGGASDLIVIGGASNDVFTIDAGSEGVTITGGAGNDLFNLNLSNLNDLTDNDSVLADVIKITDFSASNDLLDINLGAATAASFDNIESGNISGATDLDAALGVVGAATLADAADYAVFQYQGSTYVYADNDGNGYDAGDGLVQLVGFTGELNAQNFTTAL